MKTLISEFGRAVYLMMFAGLSAIGAAGTAPGDWVLVTPPAFREALGPLVERRKSEGFQVIVLENKPTDGVLALRDQIKESFKDSKSPHFVLLAGNLLGNQDASCVVPGFEGKVGRMTGQSCDVPFGLPGEDGMPTAAVGRLPARNIGEMEAMVRKTLEFERDPDPLPWRHRLLLMMGNPGGGRMADWYVKKLLNENLGALHSSWEPRMLLEVESSPFSLPKARIRPSAMEYLQQGALFSIYLGHSGAQGMGLDGWFLNRQDWARLAVPKGSGPFFTCGCFAVQHAGFGGEGYGLVAARNPMGPVAVIGASGESYAAAGQLAAEGLLACLKRPPFPLRLGDYWLSIQAGLVRGKMDSATFALLDRVDGSGGKIPLSVQRMEHLEMWNLLGDPALRMPVVPMDVSLRVSSPAAAGKRIDVSGVLPDRLVGATVRVELARPLASQAAGLEKTPPDKPENHANRDSVLVRNHQRANAFLLTSVEAAATGNQFTASLEVPADAAWGKLVIKATAIRGNESGVGVMTLPCEAMVKPN